MYVFYAFIFKGKFLTYGILILGLDESSQRGGYHSASKTR